ncbi:MAG: DUF839 domain-containing protein, partial [Desulfobacteraceae bacterium]
SFVPVTVPSNNDQKREVRASTGVTIDETTHEIGYTTILRSGDKIDGGTFGLILDQDGNPVREDSGEYLISSETDFSSLFQSGDRFYSITHFENRPGAMYLTELSQHSETGRLEAISTQNIDFSQWYGLWMPSGGSVTPWQTHLGTEKSPPDARGFEEAESVDDVDTYLKPMLRYFGITDPAAEDVTLDVIWNNINPYDYGYPIEVGVEEDGTINVNKRYALGRLAMENAYVMPDKKTIYMTDGDSNGGLYLFRADESEDLSAGNLFAAQWIQEDSIEGGMAEIEWIELGHVTQDAIKSTLDQGITFSDIFDIGRANADYTCPEGYTSINIAKSGHECLAVRGGMESVASRLETRRYAAMLGATTEFRRAEGIAYDPDDKILYIAMNEISNGMEDNSVDGKTDNKFDRGGGNHITLPYNPCGCVYALQLRSKDAVGGKYVAKNMYDVICGETASYRGSSAYNNNTCNVDSIANPHNLTFITNYKTLIISEDSESGHENDALWSYNVDDGELIRILTTPYGAESTSPYFHPDINGFAYLTSVIQHPYADSDEEPLSDSDTMGYVGYIGVMPAF